MASERRGHQFKMMVIQAGPIPPSGGPLRESYLEYHGRESLCAANDEYAKVVTLLGANVTPMPALDFSLVEHDDQVRNAIQVEKRSRWADFRRRMDQSTLDAVEPKIEKSVKSAVDALNYLEDHDLRDEAHAAIHRAAFVRRGLFGCPILLRDDEYWTACPINISHLRIGVSAGLVSNFECSVCGDLVEECAHIMGKLYPKAVGRSIAGACNICEAFVCEHINGETLLVRAHASARSIKTEEVSIVARPRYPLARIVEQSMEMGELHDDPLVKQAAERGHLNCDVDLGPCSGFTDMRDWDIANVSR